MDETRGNSLRPPITWKEATEAWRVLLDAARHLRDETSKSEGSAEEKEVQK